MDEDINFIAFTIALAIEIACPVQKINVRRVLCKETC